MAVYGYIRVSTEMQTYENQRYEIEKFCCANNIYIDKWISESVSGTVSLEKRTLGKLINKMKYGDLLICSELSRLGRNMLMIMGILNLCASKGISIRTIKDNFELSDSINSKIIAFAFALAAEIERNLISQRTKEALAVKKLNGIKLGRPPGRSHQREIFETNRDVIMELILKGNSISNVSKMYKMHRNTLRKFLNEK